MYRDARSTKHTMGLSPACFSPKFFMPTFVIAMRCHLSKIQNSRLLPAPYTHMVNLISSTIDVLKQGCSSAGHHIAVAKKLYAV